MSKIFIVAGLVLVLIGCLWPWIVKSGLGRLPGDIMIQKKNATFYFPFMTSLLISAALSLFIWIFSKRP
jgi:hypothetical protein